MIKSFKIFENKDDDVITIRVESPKEIMDVLNYFRLLGYDWMDTRPLNNEMMIQVLIDSVRRDGCIYLRFYPERYVSQSRQKGYNTITYKEWSDPEGYKKRQEEIRLKHVDVDPYGEEDWENEVLESRYYLENIDKKYYIFLIDNKMYLVNILEKKSSKKGIIFSTSLSRNRDEFYNLFPYRIPFSDGTTYYDPKHGHYFRMSLSNWKRHLNQIVFSSDNVEEVLNFFDKKRIKNIEVDPYGEEDWGYDMKESRRIKNFQMFDTYENVNESKIKTPFRYREIGDWIDLGEKYKELGGLNQLIDYLNQNFLGSGFIASSSDEPVDILVIDIRGFGKCKLYEDERISVYGKGYLEYDPNDVYQETAINLRDRIKRVERCEKKRISEVDPYGEEDWEND